MDVEVDNIWIIPYTPLLTKMFQTHINVEFCNSVKSINTFVSTATREATWAFSKLPTETTKSLNLKCDYISSNELCWRIFSFHIHDKYPSVVHLVVHLENSQRVYFTEENARQMADNPPNTTLTAFFERINIIHLRRHCCILPKSGYYCRKTFTDW